ncbi:MAG: phosphoenolpyruvate--protein phosphotransferase [Gammaproteobacteria bacterium]|nr:phosphoenolpyruvate--protein phosphotransferase [Gammaproteobacteria bacterium]
MPSMIHRLQSIVQEVGRSPDIQHALDLIANRLIHDLHANACTIFLVTNEEPPTLLLKACQGLNPDIVGTVERQFGQGLIGIVAERAEPINLTKATEHKDFILVPNSGEAEYPVYLGVPIVSHRKVLGVIAVQRSDNVFNEDDEAFLTTLAAQLATSIDHAESQGRFKLIGATREDRTEHIVKGVAGSPGMAIDQAIVLNRGVNLESVPDKKTDQTESEIQSFNDAIAKVHGDLTDQANRMRGVLPEEECALFVAYAQMLNSGSLIDDTHRRIAEGNWAPASWRDTIEEHAYVFEQMDDEYLAERANDVRDLGRRVLRKLMLEQSPYIDFPDRTVLVGDEISATDMADVPTDCLCAVLSAHGSGSSHVAILAHALGIPAVMGAVNLPVKQMDGLEVIVDGYSGSAYIDPSNGLLAEYRAYLLEEAEIEQDLLCLKDEPAETTDHHRIALYVNSGLMADHTPSLRSGAEGVGLYRTEIPFQIRDRFPSEEEQYAIYRNVLETFGKKPVVLRTLDVGGDKPLSYFPIKEANPFLGWRGIRITLDHPEIFITQVRAMLRANTGCENLQILLPMISDAGELQESLVIISRVRQELEEELGRAVKLPPVGAMIEVPSAVYQIDDICRLVDFVSIGTNDLTQYLLAVDRNNENVAGIYSSLHPAVLKAMQQIVQGAARNSTPVSVCGELAGDPLGVMALLGMGIENLSMSVGSLLKAKKVINSFSRVELESLLKQAMALGGARLVRELYAGELDKRNLGGFIRAGR